MSIKKGLATWAGLVAAFGQYLAAVAVFLEADNQSDALGPLVTATATLLAVIVGRMQQAKALASRPAAPAPVTVSTPMTSSAAGQLATALSDVVSGTIGGRVGLGFTKPTGTTATAWPTPGVGLRSVPGEFDREPKSQPAPKDEQRELPDCA